MHNGLIDQNEKFKKRIVSKNIANYKKVHKSELVVGFPLDEGVIGFQNKYEAAAVSPSYDIWKLKNCRQVHIPYLEKIFRSLQAIEIYKSKMQGTVSRRRTVHKSDFIKIKIPLPPLAVQEQIVAEIETYQKVIDGAKQVVKHWQPQIKIDPDWEMVELGEVCDIFGGGTPSRSKKEFWNGEIPWITAKYFTDEHIISGCENISTQGLKNSSSNIAPIGSTILITRVSVGKYAYADQDYAINQDLTALVPKNQKLNNKYLLLSSSVTANNIEKNAVGVGVKGVTRDFVMKQKIPLPPLAVQEQIVAEIADEQKVVDECKKFIATQQQKISDKINEVWEANNK